MKRTVAPADGERTKEMASEVERACGVRETWILSVILVTGSEGSEGSVVAILGYYVVLVLK